MTEKPTIKIFKCDSCFQIHADKTIAKQCCIQGEITPLFECGNCGNQFYVKKPAKECCNN